MNALAKLDALTRALLAQGWPDLSSWWVETLTRFVTSRRRQLVCRVGRRGGKSSTLCRFAVAFALAFDTKQIPPGDIGLVAFISTTRDEASQRLRTIKAILDALGVAFRPIEGGIELADRPIAFKVFTATVAGVSGFTAILVICDEVAKWKDADSGANPASEVLASVRPTMATQLQALIILSSSPLGNDDAHAKAYDQGATDFQHVAYAPTWIANPTVSEADTRALENDPRIWSREYEAIPQDAKLAAFDVRDVARSFDRPLAMAEGKQRVGIIDASSGKKDAWTFGVCGWRQCDGERRLVFDLVSGFEGRKFSDQERAEVIVAQVAGEFRALGVTKVFADQRESFMLASAFARNGLRFHELPWTASSKEIAVTTVRRWLADDLLVLPNHARLRAELLRFEEKITAAGGFTFGARGSGHDDYVALLLTAAMADTAGHVRGSPHVKMNATSAVAYRLANGETVESMTRRWAGV